METKKLFAVLLVLTLVVFVLCACGGENNNGGGNGGGNGGTNNRNENQAEKLRTPKLQTTDERVEWDPIDGAKEYAFTRNGEGPYSTVENFVYVEDGDEVVVWAIGDGQNWLDSDPSKPVIWHGNVGQGSERTYDPLSLRVMHLAANDNGNVVVAYAHDNEILVGGETYELYASSNPDTYELEYFQKVGDDYVKSDYENQREGRNIKLNGLWFAPLDNYSPELISGTCDLVAENGDFFRRESFYSNGESRFAFFSRCETFPGRTFVVNETEHTVSEAVFTSESVTLDGHTYEKADYCSFADDLGFNFGDGKDKDKDKDDGKDKDGDKDKYLGNPYFYAENAEVLLMPRDSYPGAAILENGTEYYVKRTASGKLYVMESSNRYSAISMTNDSLTFKGVDYVRANSCGGGTYINDTFYSFETNSLAMISYNYAIFSGERYDFSLILAGETYPTLFVNRVMNSNTVESSKIITVSGEEGRRVLSVGGAEYKQYERVEEETYLSDLGIYKTDDDVYATVNHNFEIGNERFGIYKIEEQTYLSSYNTIDDTGVLFQPIDRTENSFTFRDKTYLKLNLSEATKDVAEPILGKYLYFNAYSGTRTVYEEQTITVGEGKEAYTKIISVPKEIPCERYDSRYLSVEEFGRKYYLDGNGKTIIMMANGKIVGVKNTYNEIPYYEVLTVTDDGKLSYNGVEYSNVNNYAVATEDDMAGLAVNYGALYIAKTDYDQVGRLYNFLPVSGKLGYRSAEFKYGTTSEYPLETFYKIGDYFVSANSYFAFKLGADKLISEIGTSGYFHKEFDKLDVGEKFDDKLLNDEKFNNKYYMNVDQTQVLFATRKPTGPEIRSRTLGETEAFSQSYLLYGGVLDGETFYFYADDFYNVMYLDTSDESKTFRPMTKEDFLAIKENNDRYNSKTAGTYVRYYEDNSSSGNNYNVFQLTVNSESDVSYRMSSIKHNGVWHKGFRSYDERSSGLLEMYINGDGNLMAMEFVYQTGLSAHDSGLKTMTALFGGVGMSVHNTGIYGEQHYSYLRYQSPLTMLTSLPDDVKAAAGTYFADGKTTYRLTEADGKVYLYTYLSSVQGKEYDISSYDVVYTDGKGSFYVCSDSRDTAAWEINIGYTDQVMKGVPYLSFTFDRDSGTIFEIAEMTGENNSLYLSDEGYSHSTPFDASAYVDDGLYAATAYHDTGVSVAEIRGGELILKNFGADVSAYGYNQWKAYGDQRFELLEENGTIYAYHCGEPARFIKSHFEVGFNADGTFYTKPYHLNAWTAGGNDPTPDLVYRSARLAKYDELPEACRGSVWKSNGFTDEIVFDSSTQTVTHGEDTFTLYVTAEGKFFLNVRYDCWLITDEFIIANDIGTGADKPQGTNYFYPYKSHFAGQGSGTFGNAEGDIVIVNGDTLILPDDTVCKLYITKVYNESTRSHVTAVFAEKIAEDGAITYISVNGITDPENRPTQISVDGKNYSRFNTTETVDGTYASADGVKLTIKNGVVTVSDKDGNALDSGKILFNESTRAFVMKLDSANGQSVYPVQKDESGNLTYNGTTYLKDAESTEETA